MKAITVSTIPLNTGPRTSHYAPDMFLDSCKAFGFQPVILGLNRGNSLSAHNVQKHKIQWLREYLMDIAANQFIVFTDAWDVCYAAAEDAIRQSFATYKTAILISAEINLWPRSIASCRIPYPKAPTPWRYLNSGGICGSANALRTLLLDEAFADNVVADCHCDQDAYHKYHLRNPGMIQLDHYCRVFQSMSDSTPLQIIDGRILNRNTNSYPCILHGNGGNAPAVEKIWKRLQKELPI